jgi:hypothetical protein
MRWTEAPASRQDSSDRIRDRYLPTVTDNRAEPPDGARTSESSRSSRRSPRVPAWAWPVALLLLASGLALGVFAVYELRTVSQTSNISERQTVEPEFTPPATASAVPSGSPAPALPTETAAAQLTPTVTTTVTQTAAIPSGAVLDTMLAVAALLLLAGAVLPRFTRITPVRRGADDFASISAAAARAVTRQAMTTPGRLTMRAGTDPLTQSAAAGALASAATALAVARTQQLLSDPSTVGRELALSDDQIAQARRGVVTPQAWDVVASQALSDIGASGQ